jgi:hypothetical protein
VRENGGPESGDGGSAINFGDLLLVFSFVSFVIMIAESLRYRL